MELQTAQKLEGLKDTARVWIYQADRALTDDEVMFINEQMTHFIGEWAAHGKQLFAAFELKYNRFLILGADESMAAATGCSIDSSVHFVTDLGLKLSIDFFDRMQVAYKTEKGIETLHLTEFEKAVKSEKLNAESVVFNNLVSNIGEFKTSWEVALKNSWHARYLLFTPK